MEKYRKQDQLYIDQYDRWTIEELKKLEIAEKLELENAPPNQKLGISIMHGSNIHSFLNTGIQRARNKENSLRAAMQADEEKDYLISINSIPEIVRCNTCNSRTKFSGYYFKKDQHRQDKTNIFFLFDCPKKHTPRKIVYPDGEEYNFPIAKCQHCGGELRDMSETRNNILYSTDLCTVCGKTETFEYDLTIEPILPIDEDDRRKYCDDFLKKRTFLEDLLEIERFFNAHPELNNTEPEKITLDLIKKLTIPMVEEMLLQVCEKNSFVKFQFEKPVVDKHVTIVFSVQDPTSRTGYESSALLKKVIKKELHDTNWRLMAKGIMYRLGFLTGELKGYEQEEDLIKIAKEIYNTKKS